MDSPLTAVEATMLSACAVSTDSDNPAVLAVKYHLTTTGGQLRARIVLDAAFRLGLPADNAVTLASVCELLHNASLVHDDLMDRSLRRRGQETVWSHFGDGVAICAGDLLLNSAYACLAKLEAVSSFREITSLVHGSTHRAICGQAAELRFLQDRPRLVGDGPSEVQAYEGVAVGKSAALLSLCLELPLTMAGCRHALPAARRVAASFAVAYQIADDLLDVEEDRLANSLNLVQILSSAEPCCLEEARAGAAARAEELLIETSVLAAVLPFNCAATLVDSASQLLIQLQGSYNTPSVLMR